MEETSKPITAKEAISKIGKVTNTIKNYIDEETKKTNNSLNTKLDKADFTKTNLINIIGAFQGATETIDGVAGLVPAPLAFSE